MKPWREVCVPHGDVLQGTFQQSEFAADITAVHTGKATPEYMSARAFFERTFITEGMRLLLTQVALRLNARGGEPVIQLQTPFGGGKTHTMLAVYHLAARTAPLNDLAGIPSILDQAGLLDVPRARVAVLDGTAHSPGQAWNRSGVPVRTLWGELAAQLGGEDGYALVRDADLTGTSPGKDALRALLDRFSPCVILVDELVAYIRQFPEGHSLSGGTFESNLSFVHALTEAVKLVPTAIVLASLPESDPKKEGSGGNAQLGGLRGTQALEGLEGLFGRVHALWKPISAEEAFEIVRRRLFEPIRDPAARDAVCRAFGALYTAEGAKVPSETHEARYVDRLVRAYPIHPEVFDRLYEDWTTLEGFQRTRGVLKLMARVIHRLWKDNNQDLMILPGSLPLHDGGSRNELVYYLPPGWDAVMSRDIDGDSAETTELDLKETRFGALHAARRVARTLFLGSAPASGGNRQGVRGIDRARVLLGCLQPGQQAATYTDALNRLADRLHYLNTSGDKAADTTRFWFDTRANLRREMEDRKRRFDDRSDVTARIVEAVKKLTAGNSLFEGVHVFTPHADIPDDSALRLVVLGLDHPYSKHAVEPAFSEARNILEHNGSKPRLRGNRLAFLTADPALLVRLRDAVRTALAWSSIVDDVNKGRLNIDRLQIEQAQKELAAAEGVVPRAARDCFKWVLCPVMATATDRDLSFEAFALNTGSGTFATEIERVCAENELVISTWAPIHLRAKLKELFWKEGAPAVRTGAVWDAIQRYFYMPRLKRRGVLDQAIQAGAPSRDFFGTAYGLSGDIFDGFKIGEAVIQVDDALLLVDPGAASAYEAAQIAAREEARRRADEAARERTGAPTSPREAPRGTGSGNLTLFSDPGSSAGSPVAAAKKAFIGSVEVSATTAKMSLVSIAEDIIALLASDPNAKVQVTVEISADFPQGASEHTRRAVSENAAALGFKIKTWE
jgi:predicted AAA+ superfamily ATPase